MTKVIRVNQAEQKIDVQLLREKYALTPLEHMLQVLNDERQPKARREAMAKAAVPYLHEPLIAVKLPPKPPPQYWDLRRLTDNELIELERLVTKVSCSGAFYETLCDP